MSKHEQQRKEAAARAARGPAASEQTTPQQPRPAPRFQLLIECANEAEQEQLYRRLRQEGVRCRPLVTA